jgi:hypothetical protein
LATSAGGFALTDPCGACGDRAGALFVGGRRARRPSGRRGPPRRARRR